MQNTPNGKETFKRAVESVIKGADPKQILETFDYRIADKLIEMGSHTPQEVQQLRSVVQELDSIANASVAKSEDYGKAVRDAATHEAMKGKAIGSVLGGIVGAVGGHSQMGGLGGLVGAAGGIVGAGEGVGVYMNASAMVRNEKRIRELIDKIIADKDLFNAAMAPTSESSVKRLLGMLAKGAQTTGAVEVAEYPLQRERKAVRQ